MSSTKLRITRPPVAIGGLRLAAPQDPDQQVPTRLLGFVISPNTRSSYLGYERTDIAAPWLLAAVLRGVTAAPSWPPGMTSPAWGRMRSRFGGDISASRPDSVRRTESAGVFRAARLRERRSRDGGFTM